MAFGIQKMCHVHYEKWEKTNNERNRTAEERSRTLGEKENYKYLGILEADMIEKKRKTNEKTSRNQALLL